MYRGTLLTYLAISGLVNNLVQPIYKSVAIPKYRRHEQNYFFCDRSKILQLLTLGTILSPTNLNF